MPAPSSRVHAAEALRAIAVAALAFMPVGMALAHRSSIFWLVLSATLALGATLLLGEGRRFAGGIQAALSSPLGYASVIFLAWATASVAWSPFPALSLFSLGEFVLPLGAALVLAVLLPGRVPSWATAALAASCAAACAMILLELATGLAVRNALGMRSQNFIFNRPVLTVLVTLPPLLVLLAPLRGRPARIAAAGLAGLVVVTILVSESGAAALGGLLGLGALAAFWLLRKAALLALGAAAAVLVLGAPVLGTVAARTLPGGLHERLAASHSRERVEIWQAFGAAVRVRPVAGAGFGMSPRLPQIAAASVPPEHRNTLASAHAHNAALQVWTELGVVGVLLALAVLGLLLRALARLPDRCLAPRFALLCIVLAVALVGHGAWQGWWAASVGAACVWFRVIGARARGAMA